MKKSGVYLIRCRPTGELYVGSTTISVQHRIWAHRSMLRKRAHSSPRLQAAWDHHGEDAFEFRLLKEFPPEEVAGRELEAIKRLKPAFNVHHTNNPSTSHELPTIACCTYRKLAGIPLDAPVRRRQGATYAIKGESLTVDEIAKKYNLPRQLVLDRIYNGERGSKLCRPKGMKWIGP